MGGNGVWKRFDEMSKEEADAARAKSLEVRRENREKRLAIKRALELEQYREHHKAHMEKALQGKLALFDGLMKEMEVEVEDPDTKQKKTVYTTEHLSPARMKVLMGLIEKLEDMAYPDTKQNSGNQNTTVINQLVQIRNELANG